MRGRLRPTGRAIHPRLGAVHGPGGEVYRQLGAIPAQGGGVYPEVGAFQAGEGESGALPDALDQTVWSIRKAGDSAAVYFGQASGGQVYCGPLLGQPGTWSRTLIPSAHW